MLPNENGVRQDAAPRMTVSSSEVSFLLAEKARELELHELRLVFAALSRDELCEWLESGGGSLK
jgi:hypothetical protein